MTDSVDAVDAVSCGRGFFFFTISRTARNRCIGSSSAETGEATGSVDFALTDSVDLWISTGLSDFLAPVVILEDAVSSVISGVLEDTEASDGTTSGTGFLVFLADNVFLVTVEALVGLVVFRDSVSVDLRDSACEELETAELAFLVEVFLGVAVVFEELVFSVLFCDAVEVFFLAMIC